MNKKKKKVKRGQTPKSPRTKLKQSTLQGEILAAKDSGVFGNELPEKKIESVTRCAFQNCGPQPEFKRSEKSVTNSEGIYRGAYDVMLFAEHGLNASKLQSGHSWHDRVCMNSKKTYSNVRYNSTENDISRWKQYGGTGVTITEDMRARKSDDGGDPTKLGRWSYVRIHGRRGESTIFVSAYRPCKNTKDTGSVWMQHDRYYQQEGIENPDIHEEFITDLCYAIGRWRDEGFHVVLGMDSNEDVRDGKVTKNLEAVGMMEGVISQHKKDSAPATCAKNTNRTPIDSIWISPGVEILQCGFLPFHDYRGFDSDHRLIWVEIDNASIFGHYPQKMWKAPETRVKSNDPRCRDRYIERVLQKYEEEKIFVQCEALRQLCLDHDNGENVGPAIEELHAELKEKTIRIRRAVDDKLLKFHAGAVPWSPPIQKHRDRVEYWHRVLRTKTDVLTSRTAIKRLSKKIGEYSGFYLSTSEAIVKLKESIRAYKEAKKEAYKLRVGFNETLIQAVAKDEDKDPKMVRKRMDREKHQKDQGRVARTIRKRNIKEPVLKGVALCQETGLQKVVDTQDSLVQAVAESNLRRQKQTETTPFRTAPLRDEFGYCAENYENIQAVLDGTYNPPPGTDQYAKEFLRELQMPDAIREKGPIDINLTEEDNEQAWKRQKGGTASDSSTLAFEHYKTACQDKDLNAVDTLLRDLPTKFGFVPPSWLSVTDVEILKKAGVYDIEKMRAVQLFAAEFNITNKMIGKKVLANAEVCNEVADEQHGSRKNHQARLLVLNKVLVGDWLLLRKQAGAYGMNDAKGCFDRIVHTVAIMVLMSFGVPYLAATTLFQVIAKARHKIKTGYGTSDWVYGDEEIPISGVGQGNGLGPALWALISTKVIKMCERAGHGTTCIAPISGKLLKFLGFAFVDDADLSDCADNVNTTGEEMIGSFHRFMNRWNGGLRATGGLIAAAKTRWFLIDFVWTGSDYEYRTIEDMPGNITLPDENGRDYVVAREEVSTAFESLGVWLALDGNQEKEKKILTEAAQVFAAQVSSSNCSRNDALYTYNNSFMASMQYPMIATQFTEKEWNKIISPALQATLNSAGMAKTFPHKVLYGPELYQGMDMKHPFLLQEISHVMTHVQEAVCQSQTGHMIQMNAEAFRIEIGIPFSLNNTEYDDQRYAFYTPQCWYKSLWKFVSDDQFGIEITEDYQEIKKLREYDTYIMEQFVKRGFTGKDLTSLNYVRKYLKVVTLADIATTDGTFISKKAFEGIAGNRLRDTLGWPRTPEVLPPLFIKLWQEAITRCFLNPYNHENEKLKISNDKRLGGWYDLEIKNKKWEWYFCTYDERLYQRVGDGWKAHSKTGRRQYSYIGNFATCPSLDIIASVYQKGGHIYVESTTTFETEVLFLDEMTRSEGYDNLYDNGRWRDIQGAMRLIEAHPDILLDSHTMAEDEGKAIAQGIIDGTARIVSDGSYKKDTPVGPAGTSAFRIAPYANYKENQCITGYNWVTGTKEDQSSYRSESAGVSGSLALLDVLVKHYHIESGSVTIALDGLSAMQQCAGDWPLSIDQPCFDILQDIRGRLKSLPITVNFRWVEGHQDDKGMAYYNLDWWGLMNYKMDLAAKQYMEDVTIHPGHQKKHRINKLKYEKWSVKLNGKKLSSVTRDNLYVGLFGPRTLKYWQDKDNIPTDPEEIMWEESKLARKRMPFGSRRIDAKVLSDCCGFALTLQKRRHQDSSACPLCEQPGENRDHLLTCTDKRAEKKFEESLKPLQELLKDYKTEDNLEAAIMLVLKKHRKKQPIPTFEGELRLASQHQTEIGWNNFVLGRWSVKWGEAQQRHYERIGSKRTSKRWATAILHKLAMIRWDLWEFRNGILHAPTGPLAVAKHALLNSHIGEDFTRGKDGIDTHYYYLFAGDYTLENLQAADIITKQQWLKSVLSARQDYVPPEAAITKESKLRRQMHEYLVELGLRDENTEYTVPGPSLAPKTDKPTITEEYLQEAMDEWLNSDTTPNKKNRQNKDNNSTRNATDQESDDSTDTADEPVHQTTQDPTSESQRPYFRNINRLPKIHQERQRRHFQFLSAQPKPYQPKQQVPRTTFTQRQLSGWLL